VPELRETIVVPACGYWIQQERADTVNDVMIRLLCALA
jgi:hypothetical protein